MSTPENTGRLSVNCDGFWMTKNPLPLILPGLFLYLLLALGPSLATVVYSLTDTNGLTPAPLNFIGLDNYRELFNHLTNPDGAQSAPYSS